MWLRHKVNFYLSLSYYVKIFSAQKGVVQVSAEYGRIVSDSEQTKVLFHKVAAHIIPLETQLNSTTASSIVV